MASWNSLPPEIRNQALDQIFQVGKSCNNLAALATVSREWQAYMEPRNFRRLVLNQSSIIHFGQIMRNRKWMVKHIWLRIVLPEYSCSSCTFFEMHRQKQMNNQMFTNSLFQLLKVLGSWGDRKAYDPIDGTGPLLELSVHSPSDMKHRFDVCALDKDVYPHTFDENCSREEFNHHVERILQKEKKRGQICQNARGGGIEHLRMFADIDLDFSAIQYLIEKRLPRVDAIKGLLIRRQYYRAFHPRTVAEIARAFQTIDNVTFEPIVRTFRWADAGLEEGYNALIREVYRFKSLSIFIGFYSFDILHEPWKKLSNSFSLRLADESQHLEHLSSAFAGDGEMFFQDFLQPGSKNYRPYLDPSRPAVQNVLLERLSIAQRVRLSRLHPREEFEQALLKATGYEDGLIPRSVYKPHWLKLNTLALGSKFDNRHDLFEAAGFAALEMPELQTMEIWNEDLVLDVFEYFRYSRNDEEAEGSSTITWDSVYEEAPKQRVINAWNRVAKMRSNQCIEVIVPPPREGRKLPAYPYGVLEYLKLREKIANPISLRELEWYSDGWSRRLDQNTQTYTFVP
ncbi:hypothetical protein GGI43DRAFT_423960 [Trichoderma evansii]